MFADGIVGKARNRAPLSALSGNLKVLEVTQPLTADRDIDHFISHPHPVQ